MKAAASRATLSVAATGELGGIHRFMTKTVSSADADRMMAALQSIVSIEPFEHHGHLSHEYISQ